MKFCVKCGTQLHDDDNYCTKCGTQIINDSVLNKEKVPISTPNISTLETPQTKKKTNQKIIIPIIAWFVSASTIFILIFFVFLVIPTCNHEFEDATCIEPAKCIHCDKYKDDILGNHNWIDATCTSPEICSICNTENGEALGHTIIIDAAVKPTCSKTGLTEGSHCEVCNEVIIHQTDVDKLEHTEGEWEITDEATLTDEGTETMYCLVCGDFIDSRDTDKKVPSVIGSSFNFTDDEFIEWMNDTTNSYVGYSDISDGDMGDNTLYPIEFDGERGGIILNHGNNGKSGNVCAIMIWYDERATSTAIVAYIGSKINSAFSADESLYPLISGDSYTKGNLTAMLINLDENFTVATIAPSEFFVELLS